MNFDFDSELYQKFKWKQKEAVKNEEYLIHLDFQEPSSHQHFRNVQKSQSNGAIYLVSMELYDQVLVNSH